MIGVLRLRMPDGSIQTVTAIKGDKGDKPTKGVDYFTKEDEQQLVALVTKIVEDAINSLLNGDEVEY